MLERIENHFSCVLEKNKSSECINGCVCSGATIFLDKIIAFFFSFSLRYSFLDCLSSMCIKLDFNAPSSIEIFNGENKSKENRSRNVKCGRFSMTYIRFSPIRYDVIIRYVKANFNESHLKRNSLVSSSLRRTHGVKCSGVLLISCYILNRQHYLRDISQTFQTKKKHVVFIRTHTVRRSLCLWLCKK